MRDDRPTSTDRRSSGGLRFDPADGRLSLGTASVVLPAHPANRAVLEAYVDLAARCRGDRVADLVNIRQDDIDALALALDLSAEDLAQQVQDVLGATGAEAVRFVTRLWESRLVGNVTKAAAGIVVAGSLMAGAGAVAAAARAETGTPVKATTAVTTTVEPGTVAAAGDPATTTTTDMTAAGGWQDDTEPIIDGPLTTTPDGVGLIPPITEEADGTVLFPPSTIDRDAAGS